jgi:putative PIN family toxin of toxin-antitoxin system
MTHRSGPPRVAVDTNLVVSGLLNKHGQPRRLIRAWYAGAFVLVVSEDQLAEYDDVLHRPRLAVRFGLTSEEVDVFLEAIDRLAIRTQPRRHVPLTVRDPKDEMVLAGALGGRADYLVTGDDDLLAVRDDPRLGHLQIVTVREFLERLAGAS